MKKYITLWLLVALCVKAYPQKFFTTFFVGASSYNGDLGGSNLFLRNARPAWGLGFMNEINDRMFIRADFTYGKIRGDDKLGDKNKSRNLSFQSNIAEFSLAFEYSLFNLYDYKVSPYFYAGAAVFQFKPTTHDKSGNYIILPDYNTEGQGFYKDRKPYKLRQFAIPLGGGLMWAITDNKRIGVVFGFRKTFTDYIDDVSTTYVSAATLSQHYGNGAVAIAWRGDEINGAAYPAEGSVRGNPKSKDAYFFSGLSLRVRLQTKGKRRMSDYGVPRKQKARYDCPAAVW
ncbi:MAG TPA: DUF6089 family protein [Ferruginibacter sp.]|nr:DUF6089 family protein [Ferruginibacter sp.]